jgi:myo-inositol 2-dehydrogenase / D-chiro-inositol 1-dehydrogenase
MTTPLATISRRGFLTSTGFGLAALSATRLGAVAEEVAAPPIRLGLVGCGGRGLWIGQLFVQHGGYEIVAAADFFADGVEEAAQLFGLTPDRTFTGLECAEKMIARGGLDAVAIMSPPYFHPAQAQAAVAAGLHVYLAKPVAVDVPGCRSITASGGAARARGLVFLVDFQTRTNEFFVEAIKRVHDGAIGELCFGESTYHAGRLAVKQAPGTPEAHLRNWVFDQALSGDIIVEQNIHTLDVMSWIMRDSPPERCTGTGGRRVRLDVGDAWDHFALLYEYPGRVGVTFSSRQFDAQGTPDGILNRMFGSTGALMTAYGGEVMIRGGTDNFYRGGKTSSIYQDGAVANIAAFHQQVRARDTTNATLEPSVTSNLVAIMGRMAAYEGRTVTWPEVIASNLALRPNLSGLPR